MSNLRYPGVRPFERHERHLFFGRARDIEALYDLILLEKLLVLFGKSGYGKSSLLKAGIIPLFTEHAIDLRGYYLPLEIRLGSYVESKTPAPLEVVIKTLERTAPANAEASFLDVLYAGKDSLWYECKRRQLPEGGRFLLIFDQFEEFFTYPAPAQEAFRTELSNVLYETIPQNVRNVIDSLQIGERNFLALPFDIKVVFSIRADRLSLLDSMKDRLPGILHKRYELRALDEKQARSAIIRPAALSEEDGDFVTPPFNFTQDALDAMVRKLAAGDSEGIEAFQLQIVCQHLERQVQKGMGGDITLNDLPNFDTVYEDYYNDKLAELTVAEAKAARVAIEEGLLFVNEDTGEARRLSKDPGELVQAYARFGVTEALLAKLEQTYLLRREVNTMGRFNYEISHDTIIAPITKSRNSRRQLEEKQKIAHHRKRRVLSSVIALIAVGGLLAFWLAAWAVKQRDEALAAERMAREALAKFQEEQAARERLEFQNQKQIAVNFVKGSKTYCYLAWKTWRSMDSITARQPVLKPELEEVKAYLEHECPEQVMR